MQLLYRSEFFLSGFPFTSAKAIFAIVKFALKLFSFILIRISHTWFSYIQSKLKKKNITFTGKKKRRKELITRCLSQCSESILNVHISNAPLNTRYWTYRDARGMCEWDVVLLLLVTSRNSCQPERSQICIFMFTSSVAHLVFTITIQMHLRDIFYFA